MKTMISRMIQRSTGSAPTQPMTLCVVCVNAKNVENRCAPSRIIASMQDVRVARANTS